MQYSSLTTSSHFFKTQRIASSAENQSSEFSNKVTSITEQAIASLNAACQANHIDARSIANTLKALKEEQKSLLVGLQQSSATRQQLQSDAWIDDLLLQQTEVVNHLLIMLWQYHFSKHDSFALIATGGFGRGELFPFSDIDIAIVHKKSELNVEEQTSIAEYIQSLWDVGLKPSPQVTSVSELIVLAKTDLPVATSLLEARLLTGQIGIYEQLCAMNHAEIWPVKRFFTAKLEEQRLRHQSYLSTQYHLEPDVKNNLGGLRELHLLRWLAIKIFETQADIEDTAALENILTQTELTALTRCLQQLNGMRFALHLCVKRPDERLLFSHQILVAELLGYQIDDQDHSDSTNHRDANIRANMEGEVDVEAMMKRFYLTNQQVIELSQLVITLFQEQIAFQQAIEFQKPIDFQKTRAQTEPNNALTGEPSIENDESNKSECVRLDDEFELITVVNKQQQAYVPQKQLRLCGEFTALNVIKLFYWLAEYNLESDQIELATFRKLREVRETIFAGLYRNQLRQELPLNNEAFRQEVAKTFMQLLTHPNALKGLVAMHRLGILWRYEPSWLLIQGLMQFDRFHAYTVDEHTFQVMLQLEDSYHSNLTPCVAEVWQAVAKTDNKKWLLIAALFHDLGKGRGGNHAEIGAKMAENFFSFHPTDVKNSELQHSGLSAQAELVIWLVREHLTFSVTAQRRDISDPNVIETFAKCVKTVERLQLLFLLTIADIRGTHPTLWNSWKQSLIEQLYHQTYHFLTRKGHFNADWRERIKQHKRDAKSRLLELGFLQNSEQEAQIKMFWQRCRVDYFLSHSPVQLAWHLSELLFGAKDKQLLSDKTDRIIQSISEKNGDISSDKTLSTQPKAPNVFISNQFDHGGSELFVWAKDRKNLFAYLVAQIDRANLSIHDAKIFTNRDGMAMDSFIVSERDGKRLNSTRQEEISHKLQSALDIPLSTESKIDSGYPLQMNKRSIAVKKESIFNVKTQVRFLSSQHPNRSYLEIITLDRKGLLANIAYIIAKHNLVILGAKITTVGDRAEDMFILVDTDRNALSEDIQKVLIEALVAVL